MTVDQVLALITHLQAWAWDIEIAAHAAGDQVRAGMAADLGSQLEDAEHIVRAIAAL